MRNVMVERVTLMLNDGIKSTDSETHKLLKIFFQSCMNLNEIEKRGLSPIKNIFGQLGGWPCVVGDDWNSDNTFQWQDSQLQFLKSGFTFSYFVGLQFVMQYRAFFVALPPTLLINTEYQQYYKYMVDMAVLFGANETMAKTDMLDVIEFESKLVKVILNELETSTVQEIEEKYPFMKSYFDERLKNSTQETIYLAIALEKLFNLLESTPNRTLANYIFFHAVHESSSYLNKQVRFIRNNIMTTNILPRWSFCVENVLMFFPRQVNAIYVQKYVHNGLTHKLNDIVDRLFNEARERFNTIEYLDEYTRVNAVKKLNSTSRSYGINDDWSDISKTDELSSKYEFSLDKFLMNKLQALKYSDERTDFLQIYDMSVINAQNDLNFNGICRH